MRDTAVLLLRAKAFIPECCNDSITTAVTLPPLSEMMVPVSLTPDGLSDPLPDFMGYLAPNLPRGSEYMVAHTVTSVKEGVPLVQNRLIQLNSVLFI